MIGEHCKNIMYWITVYSTYGGHLSQIVTAKENVLVGRGMVVDVGILSVRSADRHHLHLYAGECSSGGGGRVPPRVAVVLTQMHFLCVRWLFNKSVFVMMH